MTEQKNTPIGRMGAGVESSGRPVSSPHFSTNGRGDQLLSYLGRGGQVSQYWTNKGKESLWFPVDKIPAIPEKWARQNVYFSVHPCRKIPPTNSKGEATPARSVRVQNDYVAAVNCFYAEFDAKHWEGGKAAIFTHLDTLPLYPSVIIDSGGGYHCYWLLEHTVIVTDDNRDTLRAMQAAWVQLVGGDEGSKDFARILRVPGTLNVKPEYGPDFPTVTTIEANYRRIFMFVDFEDFTEHLRQATETPPAPTHETPPAQRSARNEGVGVIHAYNERYKIVDVLTRYGYTGEGVRLSRPGKLESGGVVIHSADNVSFHWSSNDPLHRTNGNGNPLPVDPFEAYCQMEYNGNVKDAVKAAAALVGMEYKNGAGAIPDEAPDEQSNVGWVAMDETAMPELPRSAQLDEGLGAGACRWLDEYERFSREWSPRGWDDFHNAAGLMVLSTVAARRPMLPFGGRRYPNLYIAFAASTTLHGKTTTSKIAGDTIRAAGLGHLLTPDDSTPQAFVQTLAENSVTLNPDAPEHVIEAAKRRLLFSGQRGWIFEEFGEKVSSMMRAGSSMAEYRAIFLRFDDNPEKYEYRTIGRGADIVENPYLALLANVTPAYLQPFAGRGAPLWLDGFWARFVFLTPPENAERKRGRFPEGERIIPSAIVDPLREWHKRLGEPHIAQMDIRKENKDGSEGALEGIRLWRDSEHHPVNTCTLGSGVVDAYYAYDNALLDMASDNEDLLGNYGRLSEKALRVAMLFASLENDGLIEMKHWAKAQGIAERWRLNLHNLYSQLTAQVSQTKDRGYQDAIIRQIAKTGAGVTKRELVQAIRGLDAKKAAEILESLVGARILGTRQNGKREEFVIFSPDI